MALDLTPEQRQLGKDNFARTAQHLAVTRRDFLKGLAAGAGGLAAVTAAGYFGYTRLHGTPVKAALLGGGDEGGVLVGEHNPEFLEFVAVCDIRPTNMKRIFDGDPKVSLRKGFKKIYGTAAQDIARYTDYKEMLEKEKDVEAVVIALPLHLHARAAIDCMRAGKHVLCEKLMAWNISQCKKMIQVARETNRILSIGHQRHYSMLYAHAVEVMNSGVLGDVKHIRALWHRNNSWPFDPKVAAYPMVDGKVIPHPHYRDGWFPVVYQEDYDALKDKVQQYGYKDVEQLVRWRLYNETGGGLMAELGSHQLDACSIFLGKVHPLAVTAVGGKYFYRKGRNDRDSDDHVFCTYEFPGKNHPQGPNRGNDPDDLVIVTYSSINTNGFEPYGECVMGSRGSLVVEMEQSVMLYTEKDPAKKQAGNPRSLKVEVSSAGKDKAAVESTSTWGGPSAAPTAAGTVPGTGSGPISRGYREEMEDFAYCVRLWDAKQGYEKDASGNYKQRLPRCHGEVAMADAIVALTANQSMRKRERIPFKEEWFKADSKEVPDPDMKPKVPVE